MSRRCFVSSCFLLVGLALAMRTFAADDANASLQELEKPIPLKVKELPLGEVLDDVRQATGVSIAIDHGALAQAHVSLTTPVTYESKDKEPLRDSLAKVLGRMNLRFRVEDGLLRISWTRYQLLDREPQTRAVLDRLEEKVDLSFENTALDVVIKQIKKATSKGSEDNGIPIYVDPVGLAEAERTLATPISFTAKGEPLKWSLERLLKSVGLTYVVKDGLLAVTSPD